MADVEILPDWAARYVQQTISEHMHVINVLPIDKGAHSGAYLLNTSKGAVLVQKGRLTEVTHWFMPLPGERVTFRCQHCQEVMELVDPEVPRVVYCSSCGMRHYLVIQDGQLRVVSGDEAAQHVPGFHQGDYTLFMRDGPEPQYFFAKSQPPDARPAELPDGHVVQTNPRTGLPVLVPAQEESGARKRRKAAPARGKGTSEGAEGLRAQGSGGRAADGAAPGKASGGKAARRSR